MRVVVSMLVRDEVSRPYQPALTRHHLSWADEVRVLDDGSEDGTGEVLRALDPKRVLLMRNRASRWDEEGEGAARQQLLEWTLAAGGDWVVQLDGDEFVPEGARLREALAGVPASVLEESDPTVCSLRMVEVWDRDAHFGPTHISMPESAPVPDPLPTLLPRWAIRTDGFWGPRGVSIAWQAPDARTPVADAWRKGWSIPRRDLACGREPEIVRFLDAVPTGVDVLHLGWSDSTERRRRYDRYMEIDGGHYHSLAHLHSVLVPPRLEPYPAPDLDLG